MSAQSSEPGRMSLYLRKYRKPSVITGFEAGDILQGINMLLEQIASNRAGVEIQYKKKVVRGGRGIPRQLRAH